jgi:ADP-ribose pyrophosphatase
MSANPRELGPVETVWEGRFVAVRRQGSWEYVERSRGLQAAVIVAIDADLDGDCVILIEQYRVPLGQVCLELPAGLVGDEQDGETVEHSAARELEEETGYRAGRIESLGEFYSTPGLSSERFTLVRATDLAKVGDGGGTAEEDIIVRRVKLSALPDFVAAKRREGLAIDVKLLLLLAPALLG